MADRLARRIWNRMLSSGDGTWTPEAVKMHSGINQNSYDFSFMQVKGDIIQGSMSPVYAKGYLARGLGGDFAVNYGAAVQRGKYPLYFSSHCKSI